mgnify:CR=1 FL=1
MASYSDDNFFDLELLRMLLVVTYHTVPMQLWVEVLSSMTAFKRPGISEKFTTICRIKVTLDKNHAKTQRSSGLAQYKGHF